MGHFCCAIKTNILYPLYKMYFLFSLWVPNFFRLYIFSKWNDNMLIQKKDFWNRTKSTKAINNSKWCSKNMIISFFLKIHTCWKMFIKPFFRSCTPIFLHCFWWSTSLWTFYQKIEICYLQNNFWTKFMNLGQRFF